MFNRITLDEMFYLLLERDGYETWWDSENVWEGYEAEMVEAGFSADEASDFFSDLAWEL